ncbi:lipopolysaccharide assembly protein LapB [Aquincola tertiaricarbonis]|uniref:Lipopolysaccharide assembly protein B n=1 Tax=Aquincola tertiaricarbonis TaxID=391953 RepID=A0ABY4SFQ1_AQUTE|nr:lipopolysaccharide assembly protein LapB [Aquincola tertiaricarbonis]URI11410.1 lipopolysaccharide assembly protein LapB [Aquincola tertiaricarbonis]
MDFDLQWLLLGLPVMFALGWAASRFDLRQWRREQRDSPKAYFKGLNLLLNEQHDKAIDAFIEAVQNDPDTSELHFALGNLFRRRGEFERAVRVHQHLLNRGDLPQADRERAQYALAQDFMKAGLFDRAEEAYRALEGTPFETEARLALLSLHERSRDWRAAADMAAKLEKGGTGSFASRIAHYWCELAIESDERGQPEEAENCLQRAMAALPTAPRPLVLAGQRLARAGRHADAVQVWNDLRARHPATFGLIARDWARSALASQQADTARVMLQGLYERHPSLELLQALALLDPPGHEADAVQRMAQHLALHPSIAAATALMQLPPAPWGEPARTGLRQAVEQAAKPLHRYRCAACGFEAQHYFWQCPACLSWDSFPPQRLDDQ